MGVLQIQKANIADEAYRSRNYTMATRALRKMGLTGIELFMISIQCGHIQSWEHKQTKSKGHANTFEACHKSNGHICEDCEIIEIEEETPAKCNVTTLKFSAIANAPIVQSQDSFTFNILLQQDESGHQGLGYQY